MKIDDLTKEVIKFRDERSWKKYHNPKDLAIAMASELGELMEHFRCKNGNDLKQHIKKNKNEIGEELSDILYHILLIAHELKLDLPKTFMAKMKKNERKYPVSKAKGRDKKYTHYQ